MMNLMRYLEEAALRGKRVLLRINADVPIDGNKIRDDFRLLSLLPTLHYLLDYGAKIIVIAYRGRPGGKIDRDLTMRPVYLHLSALLKHPIAFAPTVFSGTTREAVKELGEREILALENIRFEPGEGDGSRTFATKLARYGEIFVNDAFGDVHRASATMVELPDLLPAYAGLLMEKEVKMLSGLLSYPDQPFVVVVGGAKVADKLPLISHLLHHADKILVGGAVANTFLLAQGVDVKKSLVDGNLIDEAKRIMRKSRGKIVIPHDYVWHKEAIVDLGSETVKSFERHIDRSRTVFWNGSLGKTDEPFGKTASRKIAEAIAEAKATTVIAGGNTVETVNECDLMDKVTFVSTGGGSALEFLSGRKLPGVKALG